MQIYTDTSTWRQASQLQTELAEGSMQISILIQAAWVPVLHRTFHVNSLTPGRYYSDVKCVISKHMLQNMFKSTFCEIGFRQPPQNTFGGK